MDRDTKFLALRSATDFRQEEHSPGQPPRAREWLVGGGLRYMLHFTCDHCGKELRNGDDRYVVKIEVFAAHDPAEITEDDLEEDHMEAVSQILEELEDGVCEVEPASKHFRYDLCD